MHPLYVAAAVAPSTKDAFDRFVCGPLDLPGAIQELGNWPRIWSLEVFAAKNGRPLTDRLGHTVLDHLRWSFDRCARIVKANEELLSHPSASEGPESIGWFRDEWRCTTIAIVEFNEKFLDVVREEGIASFVDSFGHIFEHPHNPAFRLKFKAERERLRLLDNWTSSELATGRKSEVIHSAPLHRAGAEKPSEEALNDVRRAVRQVGGSLTSRPKRGAVVRALRNEGRGKRDTTVDDCLSELVRLGEIPPKEP